MCKYSVRNHETCLTFNLYRVFILIEGTTSYLLRVAKGAFTLITKVCMCVFFGALEIEGVEHWVHFDVLARSVRMYFKLPKISVALRKLAIVTLFRNAREVESYSYVLSLLLL